MVNAPKPIGAWAVRAALSEQLDAQDALRDQLAGIFAACSRIMQGRARHGS